MIRRIIWDISVCVFLRVTQAAVIFLLLEYSLFTSMQPEIVSITQAMNTKTCRYVALSCVTVTVNINDSAKKHF